MPPELLFETDDLQASHDYLEGVLGQAPPENTNNKERPFRPAHRDGKKLVGLHPAAECRVDYNTKSGKPFQVWSGPEERVAAPAAPVSERMNPLQALHALNELRKAEAISDEEYTAKKAELLARV